MSLRDNVNEVNKFSNVQAQNDLKKNSDVRPRNRRLNWNCYRELHFVNGNNCSTDPCCAQVRRARLRQLAVPYKLHVSTNTRAVSKLRGCILLRDSVTLWRDDNRLRAVGHSREKRYWDDTKAIFVEFCRFPAHNAAPCPILAAAFVPDS